MKKMLLFTLAATLLFSLAACSNSPQAKQDEKAPSLTDEVSAESDFVIEDGVLVEYTGTAGRIIIPESVREIGKRVFYGMDIRSLAIPDSVSVIGDNAFSFCKYLEEIEIPKNVEYIGNACFDGCRALKKVVILSESIYLGRIAFHSCEALSEASIPSSAILREDVFKGCSALASVPQPDRITIGAGDEGFAVNIANVSAVTNGETTVTLLTSDKTPFTFNAGSDVNTPGKMALGFQVYLEHDNTSYAYDTCEVATDEFGFGGYIMVFTFKTDIAAEYITIKMGETSQRFDSFTYTSCD